MRYIRGYYIRRSIQVKELWYSKFITFVKLYCLITFICLIILISHIVQLLLIRKFYCFGPGLHVSFNYARYIIYLAQWHYLSKCSLIKHTYSLGDKLIVLWTLNRQAKIFLCIGKGVIRVGEGTVRADEETIRAGQDF